MYRLADLQREFAVRIFIPGAADFIAEKGLSGTERLTVYRQNTYNNLRGALREVYPVIERLVGHEFFARAADLFIRHTPSRSGDIHDFGGEYPDFLHSLPACAELPYLSDVARLEWALHEVFHAAEAGPFDASALVELPEAQHSDVRFRLNPACRLLRSVYPIARIWEVNQEGYGGDARVDLDDGGGALLVIRNDFYELEIQPLSEAEFAFLSACQSGARLGAALAIALMRDANLDAGVLVGGLIARRAVTAYEIPRMEWTP